MVWGHPGVSACCRAVVLRDGSPQNTASPCSISARQREKTETMAGNQKEARRIASAYL